MGLSNYYPHKVLSNGDFALINLPALIQNIKLITNRIEMGEQQFFRMGFQRNSPRQRGGEMTFHLFAFWEGTFENKEIYFKGQINNVLTVIRVPRDRDRFSILKRYSISNASRNMSHGL